MTFKPTANIKWFAVEYWTAFKHENTLLVQGEWSVCSEVDGIIPSGRCILKQLWVAEDGTEEWRHIELETKRT